MHKYRILLSTLFSAMLLVSLLAGCVPNGNSGEEENSAITPPTADKIEQKIADGIADPDPVVKQAWKIIRADVEDKESAHITDAEILRLELTGSFDDVKEGVVVEVYALEYRLKPEDPSKISMAGGKEIDEEGWLYDRNTPWILKESTGQDFVTFNMIYNPELERLSVRYVVLEHYGFKKNSPVRLSAIEEKIAGGIGNPDPIVNQAWEIIRNDVGNIESNSAAVYSARGEAGAIITDAEILRLELEDSFDDIKEGVIIEAYAFEYRLKPEDPSKISLAGAMYIDDDGWLADGSQHYFYVENNDGDITYITSLFPFSEGLGVRNAIIEHFELIGD